MLQKVLATCLALFSFMMGFSQAPDSTKADTTKKTSPPVTITGSVDAYYRYNFNNPKTSPYNSLTSFTHSSNSFELGMASIRADHSFGKVSATVDLGFGTRAEEFAYNDANTRLAIKQLYVTYAPSAAIKFTLGTWGTHVGYEVLDAYLNRNYSMSYMFTNGPFSHTGLKADISLGGTSALMIGIANPTDYRSAPGMPKSFIGQFSTGTKDGKVKAYFNVVAGKQNDEKKVFQGDFVGTATVSSKFSIGFNATYQSVNLMDSVKTWNKSTWWGTALYLNYDPTSWFGMTLRGEYIGDNDEYLGFKTMFAPTLSFNFKVDNLTIIPEFRLDNAGNSVFYKNATESTKSTGSFLLAATYHF
ncbi:MAG TPA: outer membrane beta-barrel protein [Puia sp.]|nr:outer membrane beta-barrel protein [Puia sp.]